MLSGITEIAAAQSEWDEDMNIGGRPFWVNVLYFQDGEAEKTLVEILIEIPYRTLAFQKSDEAYEAMAEASVAVDDMNGFPIDRNSLSEKIRAQNFLATQSNRRTHLFHFAFRLEPSSYKLRVAIGDEKLGYYFPYACAIEVPSFHKPQPQISSLVLARRLEMSGNTFILQKNGRSMLPNVSHLFTAEQSSGFLYFEAYNLAPISSPVDSFQVYCSISHPDREVCSVSWKSPKPEARAVVSLPLNLSNLAPGEYILTIRVVDLNSKREAGAVAIFYRVRPSPPALGLLKQTFWQN